jgi:hypothetical protein
MRELLVWGARESGEHAPWGALTAVWILCWPFSFVVSLWVDAKRAIARKILDGVGSKRPAA